MRSKFLKLVLVLALGAIIWLPGMALASFISLGDPLEGGSWSQPFVENGVGFFDKIEAFMIDPPGTDFEGQGWSSLSGGWTSTMPNPNYALGVGSAVTELYMTLTFTGSSSEPLSFVFLAWNGATCAESVLAVWNGGWSFTPILLGEYDRTVVPIPAAAWLLGSGLVGLVALRRRITK